MKYVEPYRMVMVELQCDFCGLKDSNKVGIYHTNNNIVDHIGLRCCENKDCIKTKNYSFDIYNSINNINFKDLFDLPPSGQLSVWRDTIKGKQECYLESGRLETIENNIYVNIKFMWNKTEWFKSVKLSDLLFWSYGDIPHLKESTLDKLIVKYRIIPSAIDTLLELKKKIVNELAICNSI